MGARELPLAESVGHPFRRESGAAAYSLSRWNGKASLPASSQLPAKEGDQPSPAGITAEEGTPFSITSARVFHPRAISLLHNGSIWASSSTPSPQNCRARRAMVSQR